MKGNKRKRNITTAERRRFTIMYNIFQKRRKRLNRLSEPRQGESDKDADKYDDFHYLRVKDEDIRGIEAWNIDAVTPVLLAPRFRAFLEGVEKVGATPATFYDIDDEGHFIKGGFRLNTENTAVPQSDNKADDAAWEAWHRVLKKIQYALDTLEATTYGVGCVGDGLNDEQLKKAEQGLLLFAKNYFCLWY